MRCPPRHRGTPLGISNEAHATMAPKRVGRLPSAATSGRAGSGAGSSARRLASRWPRGQRAPPDSRRSAPPRRRRCGRAARRRGEQALDRYDVGTLARDRLKRAQGVRVGERDRTCEVVAIVQGRQVLGRCNPDCAGHKESVYPKTPWAQIPQGRVRHERLTRPHHPVRRTLRVSTRVLSFGAVSDRITS